LSPGPGGLSGAVLVGGRSSRMGRDKARLRVGGRELWRRQVRVLRESGAGPVVLALRPRQRSFGNRDGEVRDPAADLGPLGGLVAALEACRTHWVAILAVDLPRVTPAWFRRLRRSCGPGRGAVVRGPRGFEPLAAIYPREALACCASRLKGRRLSLQATLGDLAGKGLMKVVPLRAGDKRLLENWNHPEDAVSLRPKSRARGF
jgi:molybdopterin-guanine dinucleotide biosynthesis protein A